MWDLFVRVVCERECENSRQLKTKAVFAGSSRVGFPWSEAYALHMTGMQKVRTGWRQLVFVSVSWVRPSCEIPAKHFVLINCHICTHTIYTHIIYTHITHRCWGLLLRENPSHYPWELEIVIPTFLYTIYCDFSPTPTSPFSYPWEVDSPNTYHTLSKCSVRFWYWLEALEEAKDGRCNIELVTGSKDLDKTQFREALFGVGAWRA